MLGYFLMVFVVTLSLTHSIITEDQVSQINLTEHVKKIDETLATYQAQYQAQERKDATILANILSELSQTKDDMEKLKTSHNETHSLYQQTVTELADLKTKHNKTVFQLSALHKSHKDTVLELSSLKKSYDKTVLDLMGTQTELEQIKQRQVQNALLNTDMGFQAYLGKSKNVTSSDHIVFDKIIHNHGGGYDKTTGYFTAPVSGTYLFWTNIVYRSHKLAIAFHIQSKEDIFARAYGRSDEFYGTATATTQSYLNKGEYVWLRASRAVELESVYSSTGAVLIKQY